MPSLSIYQIPILLLGGQVARLKPVLKAGLKLALPTKLSGHHKTLFSSYASQWKWYSSENAFLNGI